MLLPIAVLRADDPLDMFSIRGSALVDTGSTCSAIGPRIIAELGLRSYGKKRVSVATEERQIAAFVFRLGFFIEQTQSYHEIPTFPFIFSDIDGFGLRETNNFDVLLGMDVLRQCDLQIVRAGRWKLSFGQLP